MKKFIISFILNKPKKALLISALIFLATLPGILQLTEEYGYKAWYNSDDPLMNLYQDFEKKFGNDDSVVVMIHNPKGLVNYKNLKMIQEITEKLWEVEDIFRVDSITNYDLIHSNGDEILVSPLIDLEETKDLAEIKKRISEDQAVNGLYINKDHTVSVIHGFLRPAFEDPPDYSKITLAVQDLVKKYEQEGIEIKTLGGVALSHSFKDVSVQDINTLLPIVILLFSIVLWFIYRRKSGVILPYTVVITSILSMMGVAGYLGKTINMMSSAAPTILLTVAIADAIHIITSFFIAKDGGENHLDATRYALEKNFYPTLFTSMTTAIGFISFSTAKVKAIADIGVMITVGVGFAWFFSYFILGSLLVLFPLKNKAMKKKKKRYFDEEKLNTFIRRNKGKILISSLLVMVIATFLGTKLKVNMDPVAQFNKSNPLVKSIELMSEKMGFFSTMEIQVDSGVADGIKSPLFLKRLEKLEDWLVTLPLISNTYSVNDIVKRLNQTFNKGDKDFYKIPSKQGIVAEELFFYTLGLPEGRDLNNRISLDNRYARLSVSWNARDSLTANRYMDRVREKAKEFGLNLVITGKMPLFHDLTSYLVSTFLVSFIFALVAITIMLTFILKSFKLSLLALIPNLFPIFIGAILYYISGSYIDVGTVIVASVCLGIAVDDSIHFLFEYRRYREENLSLDESIKRIMRTTYPALFFTTLTIFLGFVCFAFAEYVPNARFGIMVSIILVFALAADFFILPAILYFLDGEKDNG